MLIGRALMADPPLLILDEPCAGLDPVAREHFLQFLDKLGSRKTAPTLILVTHHVEEIVPVFSHVLLLKVGRVLAAGPRARVLTSATLSNAFAAPVHLTRARRPILASGTSSPRRRYLDHRVQGSPLPRKFETTVVSNPGIRKAASHLGPPLRLRA